MLFNWLFKKNKTMNIDNIPSNGVVPSLPRYVYKIKIYDYDDNDKPITSIQEGVKANSDNELKSMYALCDQKIDILERREINPIQNKSSALEVNNAQQQVTPSEPYNSTDATTQESSSQTLPQAKQPDVENPLKINDGPKYFTAGGIKFKFVNGELYQKQWLKATESEAASIRIINDKNNSIFLLTGKHIEVEHWVKVEQTEEK